MARSCKVRGIFFIMLFMASILIGGCAGSGSSGTSYGGGDGGDTGAISTYSVSGQLKEAATGGAISQAQCTLTAAGGRGFLPDFIRTRKVASEITTATDSTGHYDFTGVLQGTYTLQFTKSGYVPLQVNDLIINANVTGLEHSTPQISQWPQIAGSGHPYDAQKSYIIVTAQIPGRSLARTAGIVAHITPSDGVVMGYITDTTPPTIDWNAVTTYNNGQVFFGNLTPGIQYTITFSYPGYTFQSLVVTAPPAGVLGAYVIVASVPSPTPTGSPSPSPQPSSSPSPSPSISPSPSPSPSPGGGGGGGVAPSNLSYSTPTATYTINAAIAPNTPTVTGTVTTWSVTPALPHGLALTTSGVISGTPDILQGATPYVITARNGYGFTTATISIAIVAAAPSITSRIPDIDATDVATDTTVTINFSTAMNTLSVENGFSLLSGVPGDPAVTVSPAWSNGNQTVIFSITAPAHLGYIRDYTATLNGALDTNGTAIGNTTWSFTTTGTITTVPPDNSTQLRANQIVEISFPCTMDDSSLRGAFSMTIQPAGTIKIAGAKLWYAAQNRLVMTPTTLLPTGKPYLVTITGAQDDAGNLYNFQFGFSTKGVPGNWTFPETSYLLPGGGSSYSHIAQMAADLNGDGFPDVAADGWDNHTLATFFNNSGDVPGVLGSRNDYTIVDYNWVSGGSNQNVSTEIFADVDNDGAQEVIVSSIRNYFDSGVSGRDCISVWDNNGSGLLSQHDKYNTFLAMHKVNEMAVGDFNRDGFLDLAVTSGYESAYGVGGGFMVFLNLGVDGSGVWQGFDGGTPYSMVGGSTWSITMADFNEDGCLDLAISSQDTNTIAIWRGGSPGTFVRDADISTGGTPCSPRAGDFNNDGLPDISVSNYDDNTVSILKNLGFDAGGAWLGFESATAGNTFPTASSGPVIGSVGDINSDGNNDLLTCLYSTTRDFLAFIGQGDGSLNPYAPIPTSNFNGGGPIVDMNGDGIPDIVTCDYYSPAPTVRVYLQGYTPD
jgi:hypothetical protein